jgi:hypothetical protein
MTTFLYTLKKNLFPQKSLRNEFFQWLAMFFAGLGSLFVYWVAI